MSNWYITPSDSDLMHYGTKGMKWRHRKGPQVKSVPYVRKKTAADLGAEVGADFKAQKIIKGQNKADSKTNKSKVSPLKKREIENAVKRFLKQLVAAKGPNEKKALSGIAEKYYSRLSESEKVYYKNALNKYGEKGAKIYKH